MEEKQLHWIIQSIDKEIGKCSSKSLPISAIRLLELRNNILRQFNPSNSLEWSIQDLSALEVLKKINWCVSYEKM